MIEHQEISRSKYVIVEDTRKEITNQEAREKFENLKIKGVIKGNFDGEKFELKEENYFLKIDINEIRSEFLKMTIKKIIILELLEKKTAHSIAKKINAIIKFLNFTQELKQERLKLYLEKIKYMTNYQKRIRFEGVRLILEFINGKKYAAFLSKFSELVVYESKIRELPNYSSIIEFDYILNDYIDNEKENFEKYYLVYLYWKITSVIPMRPKEFLKLKFDCIEKENNDYYLIIPRIGKGEERNLFTEQKILTTKKIANIVEKYKQITMKTRNENEKVYLLCYSRYNYDLHKKNMAKKLKNNIGEMELGELRRILKKFYEEIVWNKYHMELEEIKLGDTRHLAFCSLMLRGIDPVTIAELGNHSKITTQMSYQNHMSTFVTSYVYLLAKKISHTKKFSKNKFSFQVLNYREMKIKEIVFEGKEKIKIENGYCYDQEFPNNCSHINCEECSYFIIDYKDNKKIQDLIEENMTKLNEQIYLWQETLKSINVELKEVRTKEIMERVNYISQGIQREMIKCSNLISLEEEL